MLFPEFVKGMKTHFEITHGVQNFIGLPESNPKKVIMNIVKFDDWLHEKHGNYEEEQGLSMGEIISKEYGIEANIFSKTAMGII